MYVFTDPEAKCVTGRGGGAGRGLRRSYPPPCLLRHTQNRFSSPPSISHCPPSSLQSRFGASRLPSRYRLNHMCAQRRGEGRGLPPPKHLGGATSLTHLYSVGHVPSSPIVQGYGRLDFWRQWRPRTSDVAFQKLFTSRF